MKQHPSQLELPNLQSSQPQTRAPRDEVSVVRLIKTYKPTKADQKFRRRIKADRGNTCEACGARCSPELLSTHHILQTRIFPEFARMAENVLILCEHCHGQISGDEKFSGFTVASFYARLSPQIRQRHLAFLKLHSDSKALLDAFTRGDSAFWNSRAVDAITR